MGEEEEQGGQQVQERGRGGGEDRHMVLEGEVQKLDDRQTRNRNEVYTLFGLYMVFQGVVITAIFAAGSDPTPHLCSLWWIPFTLSLIASLTIACIIVDRMIDIGRTASAVQFVLLKQRTINIGPPSRKELLGVHFDAPLDAAQWERPFVPPTSKFGILWKDFVLAYIWGILILSFVFSTIVLASCKLVLCE